MKNPGSRYVPSCKLYICRMWIFGDLLFGYSNSNLDSLFSMWPHNYILILIFQLRTISSKLWWSRLLLLSYGFHIIIRYTFVFGDSSFLSVNRLYYKIIFSYEDCILQFITTPYEMFHLYLLCSIYFMKQCTTVEYYWKIMRLRTAHLSVNIREYVVFEKTRTYTEACYIVSFHAAIKCCCRLLWMLVWYIISVQNTVYIADFVKYLQVLPMYV